MPAWEIWDAKVSRVNWLTLLAQILSLPPTRSSKVTELQCPGTGRQTQCVVFVCKLDRLLNCFAKSNQASQRPKRSCWQEESTYSHSWLWLSVHRLRLWDTCDIYFSHSQKTNLATGQIQTHGIFYLSIKGCCSFLKGIAHPKIKMIILWPSCRAPE